MARVALIGAPGKPARQRQTIVRDWGFTDPTGNLKRVRTGATGGDFRFRFDAESI